LGAKVIEMFCISLLSPSLKKLFMFFKNIKSFFENIKRFLAELN
jgi:hypothetical protein